jgi:exoribonuclease R
MTDARDKFKSLKDLKKLSGGEPAKPVEAQVRMEGSLAKRAQESKQREVPEDATTRERIDGRPHAFGPMEHGPAPYKDESSEEMQILASFRVRTVFPKDVQNEVEKLPRDPDKSEYVGREDLRKKVVYTIDGEDAKDFDDAISIEELGDGDVEVGVHIADVAHYVRPGTALDDEALARATSVYVADQVIPMLPEGLSNNLCSLVARASASSSSAVPGRT